MHEFLAQYPVVFEKALGNLPSDGFLESINLSKLPVTKKITHKKQYGRINCK
jgi:hypothetical protein